MNRIKVLPDHVAHQIAAGEVIERPMSIVKELVENSIDSGAEKIDIYIVKGGISQIKIVDNGSGILKEDLPIALMQHATSKITDANDLYSITSLGFRGEALSSIVSVSKVTITSKTKEQENAYKINNSLMVELGAHETGTTVCVSDLFYNVPVRSKFLRTENTEYINIEQMFMKLALSHFDVHFRLYKDAKLMKNLPIAKDVYGQSLRLRTLCGTETLDNCSHINVEQNGMILKGWLGLPRYDRPQADRQFFYLNGRIIRDKVITHAIRQAFLSNDPDLRYPVYCLYLHMDTNAVDINVHPTKSEVRFRESRVIHNFITDVIAQYLDETGHVHEAESDENNQHVQHEEEPRSINTAYASNVSTDENKFYKPKNLSSNYNNLIQHNVNGRIALSKEYAKEENMLIISPKIACIKVSDGIQLIHVERSWRNYIQLLGLEEIKQHTKLCSTNLLNPARVDIGIKIAEHFEKLPDMFMLLGFSIDRISEHEVLLRTVPSILQDYDWISSAVALNSIMHKVINSNTEDLVVVFKSFIEHLTFLDLETEQIANLLTKTNNTSVRTFSESELLRML
ncbi:MAG: DNA mismatch repair endonuclease MutL [Francisellaceae bacterium]|nr:DNA mismatch repair endonuclease MutL [Francisellaceae bacterium]